MKSVVAECLTVFDGTADGFEARFRFPADLEVFAGHFPGHPLVPGVFLVEAARCAAERALGQPLRIERIREAKFTAAVRPDQEVVVKGTADAATVHAGDDVAAIVKLTLRGDDVEE